MPTTLPGAADAFYAAGNQMLAGDCAPYAEIWSEGDDISHLGPTGDLCTGRTAVFEQFAKESGMGFKVTLVADNRRFVESAEMGYMVGVERTNGMTKTGEEIPVDIRATTIFRKEACDWRVVWCVVHHHTDHF
ncbi:nuclear transport factor 2 family protein [Synechococcus sp. CS-1328]|uniref:YybH family protein n=1 Tax=Synechococcus sp. CS-1328 TaxID=2847976 RepID=UPI00223C38F3|nr:nuclear transport factor 2 family protein [Synechococcus sp. CS-1328]MCT0225953.1 nuclear transport factor 2 family protein [Synechococcus sp. CS-1328]